MTTFNADYDNTELLGQELNEEDLSQVSGGLTPTGPWDVHVDPYKDLNKVLLRAFGLNPD